MKCEQVSKRMKFSAIIQIATVFLLYLLISGIMMGIIILVYIKIMISKGIQWNVIIDYILNDTYLENNTLSLFVDLSDCVSMIFAVVLYWRIHNKNSIEKIGLIKLRKGYRDLAKGLMLGAISMVIVFIVLILSKNIYVNQYLFNSYNVKISLVTRFIVFILVGINEEMFSRGYCMTVLKESNNIYMTILISSIIFSLMHVFNNNMNMIGYLNIFLFGILTAYMFIKSKNLWLSIGYHITWNYFEGSIFGFHVSGESTVSLCDLTLSNNSIITGGSAGPEGGIVVTIILVLVFVYIWRYYKSQNLIIKMI